MIDAIKKVYNWQKLFGRNGHLVSDKPRSIDEQTAKYRADFIIEEINEYLDANKELDEVEILDALCDIQYFLYGMVAIHGMQGIFEEAFNIVHDSNMSKLGEDGNPMFREDNGKVIKGPNYWRPTNKLKQLLLSHKQSILMNDLGFPPTPKTVDLEIQDLIITNK